MRGFSRKGQIGKFLTGFVAFFFVVIIVAAFLILTSAIIKLKTRNDAVVYPFVAPGFALYKEVSSTNRGVTNYSLVYDYFIDFYGGKIKDIEVGAEFIKSLVNVNRDCFFFTQNMGEPDSAVSLLDDSSISILGTAPKNSNPWTYSNLIKFENGVSQVKNVIDIHFFNDVSFYNGKFNLVAITSPRDKALKTSYIYYYLGKCAGGTA